MTQLKIGDKAPLFTGTDQDGKSISLSDFRGRKVILYFYPKDNTPGCTAEACSLRDGRAELQRMGFEVIGVSPDSVKSHQGFIAKHGLNFPLIADADKSIAAAYGVWGEKKFIGAYLYGYFAYDVCDRPRWHDREDFRQGKYQGPLYTDRGSVSIENITEIIIWQTKPR